MIEGEWVSSYLLSGGGEGRMLLHRRFQEEWAHPHEDRNASKTCATGMVSCRLCRRAAKSMFRMYDYPNSLYIAFLSYFISMLLW